MRRANKLLALALALVFVFTFAACGESFESAMIRAVREMESVESVHADMVLDMEFGIDALGSSGSMPISVLMSMDTAGDRTSAEITMEFMGSGSGITCITAKNGETYDIYISFDGGETWVTQTGVDPGDVNFGNMTLNMDTSDIIRFYLESATSFGDPVEETVDGVTCRRYDGFFPGARLTEVLTQAGGGSFAQVPDGTNLPNAPISVWLAKGDGLPRRISIDMTDAMGQYVTGVFSGSSIPEDMLTVGAVTVTVDLSEYNSAVPLQVPAI